MPDIKNTPSDATGPTSGPMKAALLYAQNGWAVLPDEPNGKRPILANWPEAATSDLEVVQQWVEKYPTANIGIATGAKSGFFVLDVDVKNGGPATLAKLPPLPRTVEARTASGGSHYLFALPDFPVRNSAGKLGPGLDIRGEGGQIVVAPSRTPVGEYRWVNAPWDVDIAPAPEWLLELLRPKPPERDKTEISTRRIFPPATPEVLGDAAAALIAHGPAIEGEGGDEHTFIAAATLVHDFALTDEEAWPLFLEWNETCQPPWAEDDLSTKLRMGRRERERAPAYGCKRRRAPRPTIQIVAGKLSELASEAESALVDAGVQLYQRGPFLVRPIIDEVPAAHGRRTKVPRLREVQAVDLVDRMSREIRFQKWDARKKGAVDVDPPSALANVILSRDGERKFPRIAGVITTPTLRPDGSILWEPGYDSETGLLLAEPLQIPPVEVTRAAAEQSIARIDNLFAEFPFTDPPSRSVALDALLTAVARGAFAVAPAHAVSASTPGTGKSYLFDVVAAVAIGQRCPVLTAPRDEVELEKRVGAALIAGQPLMNVDNLTIGFGGDALSQAIERPIVEVRVLGKSELVRIESRASIFATGNNLTLLGDVTRRVVLARLDANLERPELRQFKGNPFDMVLANRGRYVADALTVVAAYAAAGRPNPLPRLASFEGWSDTVRSALVWLGYSDPCETQESARAEDPILGFLRAVLVTWSQRVGTGRSIAKTAAELLSQTSAPDFMEAINAVASNHGRPDARTLGKWLSRHRGRIVNGLQLNGETDSHGHASRWWVDTCGSSGFSGSFQAHS
ncbi:MAG: bifunctional DNA primase/polymerase [Myxococcaceae bacterium]|nr:bifunctional DNA primase/polymerase [Myxococcaceae bacterium]